MMTASSLHFTIGTSWGIITATENQNGSKIPKTSANGYSNDSQTATSKLSDATISSSTARTASESPRATPLRWKTLRTFTK